MSQSQATTATETYRCEYCGTTVAESDSVSRDSHDDFCSAGCYYRAKGRGVLNQIRSDHRLCSTCYSRIKDVEPIPRGKCDAADGYQHRTEHTAIVVDEFETRDTDSGFVSPSHRIEGTRWGCSCGNVDPRDTHETIQNADLATVIANCFEAVAFLFEQDAIPHPPDWMTYKAALREHWRDARYAVGRAVYADARES